MAKLKILGFMSDPSTPKTSGADREYEVKINPSNFKHKKGMLFNTDNRANASVDVKQWKGFAEETLEFTLYLDGTQYHGGNDTVETEIEKLMDTCFDYHGSVHKPMYSVVNWNSYAFLGHLKNLETDYKMFDDQGVCLGAEVHLEFTIHMDNVTASRMENRNSPDMSHLQVIRDGDRIPLICNDIYSDPTYYIQIAELNGLTNFRDVPTGKKLLFPPLINE